MKDRLILLQKLEDLRVGMDKIAGGLSTPWPPAVDLRTMARRWAEARVDRLIADALEEVHRP